MVEVVEGYGTVPGGARPFAVTGCDNIAILFFQYCTSSSADIFAVGEVEEEVDCADALL